MSTFRRFRAVLTGALLAALSLVAVAPAADAPTPRPVVSMTAEVSPDKRPIPTDAPLTLSLQTTFESVPEGGNFVLQHVTYLFGKGARFNGKLFPSCSAKQILAARGSLRVCPQGSKIGSGIATGKAVSVGITSSGKLSLFNGPGGKSITMNMLVIHPALINATISLPIVKVHGRYAFKLESTVPPELQTVLDGDIVVTRLDITTGATRVIDGRRRGYYEAASCPKHGGSAIHGDFGFNQGAAATADASVAC